MNKVGYFEIQSNDPARDTRFYGEAFGWKFIRQEGLPVEYYRIEGGGINGGLLKRPVPVPPGPAGTNAYVCSMEVEDFDKTASIILKNGGQVAMPKFAIPGRCWQGYFLDPDKNTFGVFQPDPTAR